MSTTQSADLAIIGGGIIGLAHAYAAARRGLRVVLFERDFPAVGASVRNFGLLWPIGQPHGARAALALRSREIWSDVALSAGLHFDASGSLHLAYHADEWSVLQEFAALPDDSANARMLLTPKEITARSSAVRLEKLRGALWSPTEATVDPRQAVRSLPAWLEKRHGVICRFATNVRAIDLPFVETTAGRWRVERAIVCSGADFATLYSEAFAAAPLTRCKLQMMRTAAQPDGWTLGPALCAGLTLLHYEAFRSCSSLSIVQDRFQEEMPFCLEHGIHVLLSQTTAGELAIGDSHHYGATIDPFDREDINQAILRYLKAFALAPSFDVVERWHGVYPKLTDGRPYWIASPAPGVTVVNGLGGAGMTLSFGLAEAVIDGLLGSGRSPDATLVAISSSTGAAEAIESIT